jgi:hypothetical protein
MPRRARLAAVLGLKKTDMPVKMGFVGNEAYETGNPR